MEEHVPNLRLQLDLEAYLHSLRPWLLSLWASRCAHQDFGLLLHSSTAAALLFLPTCMRLNDRAEKERGEKALFWRHPAHLERRRFIVARSHQIQRINGAPENILTTC